MAAALIGGFALSAQEPADQHAPQQAPPNELVRQAVDNDFKAQQQDHTMWAYRQKTENSGETAVVVETKKGEFTRVIERNGKPLTEDQQKTEDQALDKLVSDAAAQQKQQRSQNEDVAKFDELYKLLPEALTYSYAGQDATTTKLTFKPNPDFHPSSREARAFHEMDGKMVIDTKRKRIVEFSGHLAHEVKFGILGHLAEGGTLEIHQEEVGPDHWEITLLKVNMKGKALFFKTVSVQQDQLRSHFERVPDDLSVSQAADLLKKQSAN